MHFLLFVLVGLIAGALAGRVVSAQDFGIMGDIAAGIVGAFLGGWISVGVLGTGGSGFFVSLFVAFVGAVVLLWLVRLIGPARA